MAITKANAFGNGQNFYVGAATLYQVRGVVGRGPAFVYVSDYGDAPIAGLAPDVVVPTEGGEFVLDFGANGRPMVNGITVFLSTTFETSTPYEDSGSTAPSFFDVTYEAT